MRYFYLLPAVALDVVQFLVGVAFIAMQFATPVGLGAATGLGAAYYCWQASSGIISGIANAAACFAGGGFVGAGVSAFAIPLGAAVDTALSITIGAVVIMMLAMNGMFYPRVIIPRMLGEIVPFFSFLPMWSNMVWKCIKEKEKAEGAPAGTFGQALSFVTAPKTTLAGSLSQGAGAMAQRRLAPAQKFDTSMHKEVRETFKSAYHAPSRFADIRPAARGAALALLLMVGVQAHAQTVPAPVQYIVAPETPGAHETVIIEVQGVGSFLGSADITWSKDGKVVKEGIGERSFSFVTGGLGEKTTVRATIDSSQGFFTRTFTFNPSRINLIWEADTTVPPLYQGKAMYSAGSDYKVVALPTVYSGSSRIAASALSYQWSYRGDAVPEVSGLGRNVFTHTGDQLQPSEDIAVDAYYGVNKVGHAELSLSATPPFILLYPYDALRGPLYDSALPAAISLAAKEITIQAEAFYFSTATKKSGLIPFVWTLSGTETAGPDSARGLLTLRQTGAGSGSADIGVSMQNNNPEQLVQSAQTKLQLVFGAAQSNPLLNFFGL